jgi:hypothetical protein
MFPALSYACGTKTEKSCCKKVMSSKTEKKDCCKNKQSKDKDSSSCGGKCGHSNCTTSSIQFSLVFFNDIKFNNNNFDFSSIKQNFYYSITNIAAGFYSIWLIPKIG